MPKTVAQRALGVLQLGAIVVAGGASGLVAGMVDDDPMCIETVVLVSTQASTASPTRGYEGKPTSRGSRNTMAKLFFAAHRRTSSAAARGSHSGTSVSGMRRHGPSPHQTSIIQSL